VAWQWQGKKESNSDSEVPTFHITVTIPKASAFEIHLPFAARFVEVEGHYSWSAGQSGRKSPHLSLLTPGSGNVTLVSEQGGSYSIFAKSI
jgi:hypothetical protein